jgi:hypothetical protein
MPIRPCCILAAALLILLAQRSAAQQMEDARLACDRAAAQVERAWNLPTGLLSAIGTVESGRIDADGNRHAWPWSINADGTGYFAASKPEAIDLVHALQARGARYIDVGCFQVDLFYHPDAFATLDQAFDPDANAGAAARILVQGRFNSTGWDQAVAAYHSASLLKGSWYLQRVMAAWHNAPMPLAAPAISAGERPGYVVLLAPAAKLVRVITATDPSPLPMAGLPRVISPSGVPGQVHLLEPAGLPRVLAPAEVLPRRSGRL